MNKYLLAGGVAALAFAAKYAYQKYFNKHQVIPKNVVIKKLTDTKQYLYPLLFQIAQVVLTKLAPQGVPPDQAKLFIMQSQQLAFRQNIIKVLSQKIYYDIDQQTLRYAIQTTYGQDKQVQFYKNDFQQQYEKCFLGIKPQPLSTKMIILNEQILLNIAKSLLQSKVERLKQIVGQCSKKNKDKSSEEWHVEFVARLQEWLIRDERQDDWGRNQMLSQHGINDQKMFEFAIATFLKDSPDFGNKYKQIQTQYRQNVQKVMAKEQ